MMFIGRYVINDGMDKIHKITDLLLLKSIKTAVSKLSIACREFDLILDFKFESKWMRKWKKNGII